MQKVTTKIYRL